MKVIELEFERSVPNNAHAGWAALSDRAIRVCRVGLLELFDIPADAERISLSLHSEPSGNRYCVVIRESCCTRGTAHAEVYRGAARGVPFATFDAPRWDNILVKALNGKQQRTLYLQCEYEEPVKPTIDRKALAAERAAAKEVCEHASRRVPDDVHALACYLYGFWRRTANMAQDGMLDTKCLIGRIREDLLPALDHITKNHEIPSAY